MCNILDLEKSHTFYSYSELQFPWYKDDAEQNELNSFLICSPDQVSKSEGHLPNIWQQGHKKPMVLRKTIAGDARLRNKMVDEGKSVTFCFCSAFV